MVWERFWRQTGEWRLPTSCDSSDDVGGQTTSYNCDHCYDGIQANCGSLGNLDPLPVPWFDFFYDSDWGKMSAVKFWHYRVGHGGMEIKVYHSGGSTVVYYVVHPPENQWVIVNFGPFDDVEKVRFTWNSITGWSTGYLCLLEFFIDYEEDGVTDVNVLASVLPTGAASSAKQDTMITALQLIDDLRTALDSVDTDKLVVRGENQLFSFKDVYQEKVFDADTAAETVALESTPVLEGEILIVTNIWVRNQVTLNNAVRLIVFTPGDSVWFSVVTPTSIESGDAWGGQVILKYQQYIRAAFVDCLLHDWVTVCFTGYKMTKAT